MQDIKDCDGYKKLLSEVERDERESPGFHNYRAQLSWAVSRAEAYAKKIGVEAADVLNAWEKRRNYWYMNFYQDSNQPDVEDKKFRVFESKEDLNQSVGSQGFRCPSCEGVSLNPYTCTVGGNCCWKVYGLFKDLGRGAFVFCKDLMHGETIFMPVAWENHSLAEACKEG
jgi:hypothetical protein